MKDQLVWAHFLQSTVCKLAICLQRHMGRDSELADGLAGDKNGLA